MSAQRHIVRRQLIELQVHGTLEQAHRLQTEVGRVYRQRVLPLIDKYCSQLSEPDRLHRIETLEIDLGQIDPNQLENDLLRALDTELHTALAEQISSQEHDPKRGTPKGTSQLELLAFYARTGSLPWWADSTQPQGLEDCLAYVIQHHPQQLRQLMKELILEVTPLERLVRYYSADLLAQLAASLAPGLKTSLLRDPKDLIALLGKTRLAASRGARQIYYHTWRHTIQVAGLSIEPHQSAASFYKGVLSRVAADLGLSYTALLDEIQQVAASGRETPHAEFKATLAAMRQKTPLDADGGPQPQASSQPAEGSYAHLIDALGRLARHLPAALQQSLRSVIRDLETAQESGEGLSRHTAERIMGILRSALTSPSGVGSLPPDLASPVLGGTKGSAGYPTQVDDETLGAVEDLTRDKEDLRFAEQLREDLATIFSQLIIAAGMSRADVAELTQSLMSAAGADGELFAEALRQVLPRPRETFEDRASADRELAKTARIERADLLPPADVATDEQGQPTAQQKALDLSFSDGEAIYIGNAGLVILWPFLSHLFQHLELVEEHQFKHPAARQRAVGLLQHLASGESDFPEYLLPLDKILCGMGVSEVFDFGPPLSEPEMDECENLLQAAIAQAAILREMSVAGLRSTFLLREGKLSRRDGAWLLQVAAETYDIVLERFPWSWEWVKLPWMETPLRVEW